MVCFYYSIHRDDIYACRLARQIKHFYPDADQVAIGDGPAHPKTIDLLTATEVQYYKGQRLKLEKFGMQFSHRNLSIVMTRTKAKLWIKIDPDSYLWRPFNGFPDAEFFGQVHTKIIENVFPDGVTYCHGGCWGVRRSLAQRMVDSELFFNPIYKRPEIGYTRYGHKRLRKFGDGPKTLERIPHEDFPFGDVAYQLGAKPEPWYEVKLKGTQEMIQEPPYKYAVTHPVRHIP